NMMSPTRSRQSERTSGEASAHAGNALRAAATAASTSPFPPSGNLATMSRVSDGFSLSWASAAATRSPPMNCVSDCVWLLMSRLCRLRVVRGKHRVVRLALAPQVLNRFEGAALGLGHVPQHEQRSQQTHCAVDPVGETVIEQGVQHGAAVED